MREIKINKILQFLQFLQFYSFIHLIDYMKTNMMHCLLINTYQNFIEILKIYTSFLPSDEDIDNDIIDLPLKENRPASHRVQV